jgi:hypothetical protein
VRLRRSALALPLAALLITVLAGCVQSSNSTATPKPVPSSTRSATPTPTPTGSATPSTDAGYNPSGTAEDNLAYFDKVGHELLDHNPTANAQGETIVNWFVAHGFTKANMEVTPDKTSIGLAAWNIEFSVKIGDSCLLGQAGNVGFQSSVLPVLATGKCLIGTTRTINF